MATSADIGIILPDGQYKYIQCWSGGYPRGVGYELLRSWNKALRIKQLLKYGNIEALDKYPYVIYNKARDNVIAPNNTDGESYVSPLRDEQKNGADYVYYYQNGSWFVTETGDDGYSAPLNFAITLNSHKTTPPKKPFSKLEHAYKRML